MNHRPVVGLIFVLMLILSAFVASTYPRALPLGIHTLRADDALLRHAKNLGAQYIIQVFAWNEIEPTRGEYHWEYTDWLVRAAEYYDLKIIARLDRTPRWATAFVSEYSAPPDRLTDFGDFVTRVATRYRGRIAGYIIWNEPNLAREWGYLPPDPVAYTRLLEHAAARLRAADPNARIVCAGLAPTNEHSARAMDDRDFLRAMYAAGARDLCDVLAAHPYPFGHPADDARGAHGGLNFRRLHDLREIMLTHNDTKPIWITEFGYTTEATIETVTTRVSEEEQARGLARAYEIAREEMPFVELFGVWNLSQGLPTTDEKAGYSLLRADGSPKPAYTSLQSLWQEPLLTTLSKTLARAVTAPTAPDAFVVLARDVRVHLGDSEHPEPWVPLYKTRNPSPTWIGEFYLRASDLHSAPRDQTWRLTMELMQVNDFNNRVWVNDRPVTPPYLPTEDFSTMWTQAEFLVPIEYLRVGRNTITLRAGKLFPAFQHLGYTWDDFQVRQVIVWRPSLR
jgi:hypothetical protein